MHPIQLVGLLLGLGCVVQQRADVCYVFDQHLQGRLFADALLHRVRPARLHLSEVQARSTSLS